MDTLTPHQIERDMMDQDVSVVVKLAKAIEAYTASSSVRRKSAGGKRKRQLSGREGASYFSEHASPVSEAPVSEDDAGFATEPSARPSAAASAVLPHRPTRRRQRRQTRSTQLVATPTASLDSQPIYTGWQDLHHDIVLHIFDFLWVPVQYNKFIDNAFFISKILLGKFKSQRNVCERRTYLLFRSLEIDECMFVERGTLYRFIYEHVRYMRVVARVSFNKKHFQGLEFPRLVSAELFMPINTIDKFLPLADCHNINKKVKAVVVSGCSMPADNVLEYFPAMVKFHAKNGQLKFNDQSSALLDKVVEVRADGSNSLQVLFSRFRGLRHLETTGTSDISHVPIHLANFIKSLRIDNASIVRWSDPQTKKVAHNLSLRNLDLSTCKISGLQGIGSLLGLQSLSIAYQDFSKSMPGFEELVECRQLTRLNLVGSGRMSSGALRRTLKRLIARGQLMALSIRLVEKPIFLPPFEELGFDSTESRIGWIDVVGCQGVNESHISCLLRSRHLIEANFSSISITEDSRRRLVEAGILLGNRLRFVRLFE